MSECVVVSGTGLDIGDKLCDERRRHTCIACTVDTDVASLSEMIAEIVGGIGVFGWSTRGG